MQCQGTTRSGVRCRRFVNPQIGYCHDHINQKSLQEGLQKPMQPPRTKTNIMHLPPDVLRKIASEMKSGEILRLCEVNKQFNESICNNRAFWTMRAQDKNIDIPANANLTDIRQQLAILEENPTVFDIHSLIYRRGGYERGKITPVFEYTWNIPADASNLNKVFNSLKQQYLDYYTHVGTEDYPGKWDVATPEQFNEDLERIPKQMKEFDILDMTEPEYTDAADLYFVALAGKGLRFYPMEQRTVEINGNIVDYVMLPPEAFPLFEQLYRQCGEPISRETIEKVYPSIQYDFGIQLPTGDYYLIRYGTAITVQGVPLYAVTLDDESNGNSENEDED